MTYNTLQSISLFSELSDQELGKIIPLLNEQLYHAGTNIYSSGEPSENLCMIKSGSVVIANDLDDDMVTLAHLDLGYFFGESGILKENQIHQSEARAKDDDTVIIKMSRDNFIKLKAKDPSLALKIVEKIASVLSERLAEDTTRIAIISAISDLVNNPDNLNNISALAQEILAITVRAIPAHQAFLGVYKKYEKDQIDILASSGLSAKHIPKTLPSDSDQYLKKLYEKDGEIRLSTSQYKTSENVFYARRNILGRSITIEGDRIGVVILSDKRKGEFSNQNSFMLSIIASQVSFALQEANLRKQQIAQEELKREYVGI